MHPIARKRRAKREREAFRYQFDIVNIHSGHVVTMNDDGVTKEGLPNQQRTALLKKIADAVDADGDPVFVLPGDPPAFMLEHDAGAQIRVAPMLKTLSDPSKSKRYKTLGDKLAANRKAYEARQRATNAGNGDGSLPPAVQVLADRVAAAVSARSDADAVGALKGAKPVEGGADA